MTLSDIKPYVSLPFHGVVLPTYNITAAQRESIGLKQECSALEFMRQLCRAGWREKIAKTIPKDKQSVYLDRMNMELDTIEALGFTNYILMVWDICRFADENKIPRGPGRGSVSSSLVCNLLSITDVDPIENGLFFTRFLSKSRAKTTVVNGVTYVDGGLVADIDMDFCYYRRQEVIDYIGQRYPGQTAKLLTTQLFTSRVLMKDVLKVYEGLQEAQVKEVSDIIQDDTGTPVTVERSMWGDKKWQDGNKESDWPPNERFVEWTKEHAESVEIALNLEGLNHGEGMHASAVAICAMPIKDLMPLQLSSKKETVTSYDMYDVQEVALKFDILGLKAVSILEDCGKALGIDWRKIDINDPAIYIQLQDFRLRYGIFQLETWAQGTAAAKVKPKTFDQLSSVLAIARPGAISYLQQFADYVNLGTKKTVHPLIDDILEPTGFVCVYQEQFLQMLVRVGLTPDEAEGIRKIVGKKLKEKIPEAKAKIQEVCKRNGHPIEIVDLLLKIAEESGGYQFAKAHSQAYAKITAWTLYLKIKHPLVFFWANLQMIINESDRYEKLATVEMEMRELGLALLPPRLSVDGLDFKIEGKNIRCGLGMVRGISEENEAKLRLFIDKTRLDPNTNKFEVFNAIRNAGLNIGVGSALIQAGCMTGYDTYAKDGKPYQSRSRLVLEFCLWNKSDLLNDKERAACLTVGEKLGWDVMKAVKYLVDEAKDEKGKPVIKPSRFETIKRRYEPYKEIYTQNSRNERLANYFYEKTVLGFSYSENIRDIFSEYVEGLVTIAEAKKLPEKSKCRLIGFAKEKPLVSKTKAGNKKLKIILSDDTGEMVVLVFNDAIDSIKDMNGRVIEENDLLIVNCVKKEGSTCFGSYGLDGSVVSIQSAKIFTKLSELSKERKKAAETVKGAAGTVEQQAVKEQEAEADAEQKVAP